MLRQRFVVIWVLFSGLYVVLAGLGPNGLLQTGQWPQSSQHMLQARAWLGEDIEVPATETSAERRIEVAPGLDVTPYIRHLVMVDGRDQAVIANLACGVPAVGGSLVPLQEVWKDHPDRGHELLDRAVCHVGFPPGPAFVLLPLRLLLGGMVASQWLAAILGGLAVAAMDRLLRAWLEAVDGQPSPVPLTNGMAVLAGLGTLWLWMVPGGGTFLFAQTVATSALAVALLCAWQRWWWLAGLAFALALSSRPTMVFAAPLLLAVLIHHQRRRQAAVLGPLLRAAALPVLAVVVMAVLNQLRFGSFLDFGYGLMITPPELLEKLTIHGQFSLVFLAENLRWVVLAPPRLVHDAVTGQLLFPFLVSDPRGMGIFFVTPAFIALVLARGRCREGRPLIWAAWLSLLLIILPGLLYFNSGWVQWGGRFLVDAWPVLLMLCALGLRRMPPRLVMLLIIASVISNLWAVLLTTFGVWPACCS